MIHLLFAPVLLVVLLFVLVVRLITAPFRWSRWHRRGGWYGDGWGYGRYAYGRPRGMGLLTVLVLVALERLFDRRY
jgi:hypothetical protein